MSTSAVKRQTVAEYLAFERSSDTKHQYYDGEIFAMTGGSEPHSLIGANLIRALGNALHGRGCRVYTGDMRIATPSGLWTYPDASVVCGPPELEDDHGDTLLNPLVVFEVLSPTTEAYDRGRKFAHYRTIPTLRAVVLVAQDEPLVERFARQDETAGWLLSDCRDPAGRIAVPALGCELNLSDIYDQVDFPEESEGIPTSQ
jgi:Uma2 family endonuclease